MTEQDLAKLERYATVVRDLQIKLMVACVSRPDDSAESALAKTLPLRAEMARFEKATGQGRCLTWDGMRVSLAHLCELAIKELRS